MGDRGTPGSKEVAEGTRVFRAIHTSVVTARARAKLTLARLALAVLTALIALAGGVAPALANGASRTIYMSYLADVSNWGPRDATATATVNVGEGTIRLEATGLPSLQDEVYEVWLVTADRGTWATLGRFEAGASERTVYEGEVSGVEVVDYRYLVLTVEAAEDPDPSPSGVCSIGGVFPNSEALPVQWSVPVALSIAPPEATEGRVEAVEVAAGPPPEYLPETGAASSPPLSVGLIATVAALCLARAAGAGAAGAADAGNIHRQ